MSHLYYIIHEMFPSTNGTSKAQGYLLGIGPSTFTAIFALVETGKTAFLVSTLFGPNGFMQQGAKVMILGNEEPVERTALRAVSALTGMKDAEIVANTAKAHNLWDVYASQCVFLDTDQVPSMEELDQIIAKHKPDIIGIDQLDKMQIGGDYARDDIRLGEIYHTARILSKKHSCAVIECLKPTLKQMVELY